jgi:hypothetical protein
VRGKPSLKVDTESFWRDGFAIIRGAYTPAEIRAFRECVLDSAAWDGDLLTHPRLNTALLDGRLLTIARQILGSGDVWYGGDSSVTIDSDHHFWHKDNVDREDGEGPDWSSRYTMLRFGIYLQDHTRHSKGLNLRVGSHDSTELRSGKNIYLRTGVGDIAVWSMRMSHSGNGTALRFPWWIDPDPDQDGSYPFYWIPAPSKPKRIALFAALGGNDSHFKRYHDYLKTRTYIVDMWRQRPFSREHLMAAERAGLTVRDLPAEVADDPHAGKNAAWAPYPY